MTRAKIDVKTLRGLFDAGKTDAEIAKYFGSTEQSIKNIRCRKGMHRAQGRRPPVFSVQKMLSLKEQGKTHRQIGAILGCSHSTVTNALSRLRSEGGQCANAANTQKPDKRMVAKVRFAFTFPTCPVDEALFARTMIAFEGLHT